MQITLVEGFQRKEKIVSRIFFCSRPFRFIFAFRSLAKNAKKNFAKFRFNLFRKQMRKFREKIITIERM